ncbi:MULTISPECIES: transposase family protein, partial [unclassified Streptomyces]
LSLHTRDNRRPGLLRTDLTEAMKTIRTKAFVILDRTLLPIDRIAADTPNYSGEHKRHGMNVQVPTDPFGRLLWASPALAGSVHDLTAARTHGITGALAATELKCWADKAYQGAGHPIRVPLPRSSPQAVAASAQQHTRRDPLPRRAGHGNSEGLALLRKLRCSTTRITAIVQAVLVLHHAST